MTKKFLMDNRGQVLYAVLVTVMFLGVLSMITMGLTLQHYHAAQQKQAHVTDYYAADAVAEMLRIQGDSNIEAIETEWNVEIDNSIEVNEIKYYTIEHGTVTLTVGIKDKEFKSWEVSYHAVETQAEPDPAE